MRCRGRLSRKGLIANVIDLPGLGFEMEEEGLVAVVHLAGLALIDGAEMVGAGVTEKLM